MAAYHPKALYSISLNLNSDAAVKSAKFDDNSFRDSRNLKKVNDKGKLTFKIYENKIYHVIMIQINQKKFSECCTMVILK